MLTILRPWMISLAMHAAAAGIMVSLAVGDGHEPSTGRDEVSVSEVRLGSNAPAPAPSFAPPAPPRPLNVDPPPRISPERWTLPPLKLTADRVLPHDISSGSDTATTHPPRPSFNPPPEYPVQARRNGHEGRVRLGCSVSSEGLPFAIVVRESSGHRVLDDAAVRAMQRWRFSPGARQESFEVAFRFQLSP